MNLGTEAVLGVMVMVVMTVMVPSSRERRACTYQH